MCILIELGLLIGFCFWKKYCDCNSVDWWAASLVSLISLYILIEQGLLIEFRFWKMYCDCRIVVWWAARYTNNMHRMVIGVCWRPIYLGFIYYDKNKMYHIIYGVSTKRRPKTEDLQSAMKYTSLRFVVLAPKTTKRRPKTEDVQIAKKYASLRFVVLTPKTTKRRPSLKCIKNTENCPEFLLFVYYRPRRITWHFQNFENLKVFVL